MPWPNPDTWPKDQVLPAAYRRRMRLHSYHAARDSDLEGWITSNLQNAAWWEERPEKPNALVIAASHREVAADMARILAWRRQGPDGPFR